MVVSRQTPIMLTMRARRYSGMQAMQTLLMKPPCPTSMRSRVSSLRVLRMPAAGLPSESSTISSMGRPLTPPALLMRSAATSCPTLAISPPPAAGPVSG